MSHFLAAQNDFDVESALTAMIVCPTLDDAVEVLAAQGMTVSAAKLEVFRSGNIEHGTIRERYEKRREELAPMLEGILANDMLDTARRSEIVINFAIEKTEELLRDGRVADPSKVARDLSQVRTQAIDKRLAMQGRPTQIVETRDVSQILRALESLGVVRLESENAIDGTAEEDGT